MTYQQCLDFLYSQLPMYQKYGSTALKYDLGNITALCEALDNPQDQFLSVHVAGTNGKGSSCHALAAITQTAGYKTGLYTSPHLYDYRERIRVNGEAISPNNIIDFVESNQSLIESLKPSFFEITVALAFNYFAGHHVDIAIVEVGLGGRLDSTNIITPTVALVTNIGYDHQEILGETLNKIAQEKAGIIKADIPVVLGETHPDINEVFASQSKVMNAPFYRAQDEFKVRVLASTPKLLMEIYGQGELLYPQLTMDLNGPYQSQNIPGILQTISILNEGKFDIAKEHIEIGLNHITSLTGIKGRWQTLGERPLVICDTGHNREAMEFIVRQLLNQNQATLHMVLGFVDDKDIDSMLKLLPTSGKYYFCAAKVPRSLDCEALQKQAAKYGLEGMAISDTKEAVAAAKRQADADDLIFIGGSTFVVAELSGL